MSECDIKIEIRQIVNRAGTTSPKATHSIAKIIKMRHNNLDKQYILSITKNILQESNQKETL